MKSYYNLWKTKNTSFTFLFKAVNRKNLKYIS